MKKSLKKLQFKKEVVTNLDTQKVVGGVQHCGPTLVTCTSVPLEGAKNLCYMF